MMITGCGKKVEVLFETNGGSAIEKITDPDKVNFNVLPTTTRTGYTFKGWYIDVELTKAIEANIPGKYKKITLYAKWEVNTYTIHFETNGGSNVNDVTLPYGTVVTEPATTLIGNTFGGWYTDSSLQNRYTFATMPAQDITLYANWVLNNYTISFEENGGIEIADITQGYNTSVTEPTPERTGYRFIGWYEDADLVNAYEFSVMPLGGKSLYAKWQINTYTISFVSNAEITVTSITAEYNKPITKPDDPIRQGYTFLGWFEDEALSKPYVFTTMPAENLTLYAKWQAGNAVITFITNGGSNVAQILAAVGSDVTKPDDPTKDGYAFGGWYKNIQLTDAYTFSTMPVVGITLYAKWIPNSYTITFDVDGGSPVDPITAEYNNRVYAPADPVKDGFVFDGWYADEALTIRYEFNFMPKENITVYASWIDVSTAQLINKVKTLQTQTPLVVEGVVYAKMIDSYTGFYIFDNTGTIFISSDHSTVAIGDKVSVTGMYDVWNDIPMINNVSALTILSSGNTLMTPEVGDVASLKMICSPLDVSNYGRIFDLEGVILYKNGYYYLSDITGNMIRISHKSYDYRAVMSLTVTPSIDSFLDQLVTMNLILEEYDFAESLWIGSFVEGTLEGQQVTDQEKLNYIVNNLQAFESRTYRPYDFFELPASDIFQWSQISYAASGVNSSLYDGITHQFVMCTGENIVDFSLTITINGVNYEETLHITVNFTESTIAELLNGNEDTEYVVQGMVVQSQSDFGQHIIWDGTDYLLLNNWEGDLKVGDGVFVIAHPDNYSQHVEVDMSDPSNRLYKISNYVPMLHVPETKTLAEVAQMDVSDPLSYLRWVETRGYITVDEDQEFIRITADQTTFNIMPTNSTAYELLKKYEGMEVILRVTTVPIIEGIMFIFNGYRDEIRIPTYTDEELVSVLQKLIVAEFGQKPFKPYETFSIWPYHPLLGGTITWSLSDSSKPYFNETEQKFINVEESVPIQINVSITNNAASLNFTLQTNLEPLAFLMPDFDTTTTAFGYVQGVVVYHSFDCTYLLYGDNIYRINGYLPTYKGDHIIIKVYTDYFNGHPTLYVNSDDYYFEVWTKNNPYELVAEEMTLEEISTNNEFNRYFFNDYITVSGILKEENYNMILTDGQHKVKLDVCDGYTYDELKQYIGREVILKAFVEGVEEDEAQNQIWTLFYSGLEGEFELVTYTPEQQMAKIKTDILAKYQDTWYVGDSYLDFMAAHPVFASTITFLAKGENASYVNMADGFLSEVTVKTEVTIEVSITVGILTETFDLILTIVPEETSQVVITSIADFKQSHGEVLTVRGVIVYFCSSYVIIQDDTDRILVRIVLSDGTSNLNKLVEVTGSLVKVYGRYEVAVANFEVKAINQTVIIDYPEITINDLINYDIYDETKHLNAVTIRGMLMRDPYNGNYYITDGYDKVFIAYDWTYSYNLYNFTGYDIFFQGYTYGQDVTANRDGWYVSPISSSIYLDGYTDEELMDIAGSAIVNEYDGTVYNCFSYLYFNLPNNILMNTMLTYEVLDDPDQIIDINNNRINYTPETKDYTIRLTISKDTIVRTFTFTITVQGMSLTLLSDVVSPVGEYYEEINMMAVFFHAADGTKYFLVGSEIFVLNDNFDEDGYFNDGDTVLISGIKTVSNSYGGFGYEISFNPIDNESYTPVDLYFYQTDMISLYDPATDKNFLTTKYLELTGQLLYDHVMGMYYLKDGNNIVYIRCGIGEEPTIMMRDDSDGGGQYSWYLEEYLHAFVNIRVLFPNLTVRGGVYLVDFKELENAIMPMDLTPYEIVTLTKQRMLEEMDGLAFYAGDYFNFNEYFPPYYPVVTYEFDKPLWDGSYFSWVRTPQDLSVTVTVSYTADITSETTFTLHMTINPVAITPIEDVQRGDLGDTFYIEGVVQAVDTMWHNFLIIKDDTGSIRVDMYEVSNAVVGDKVIAKGDIRLEGSTVVVNWGSVVEITGTLQGVDNTAQPITVDEIEKMDYYHQPDNLKLVKVTGVIKKTSLYNYELVCGDQVLDIVYIRTADVNSETVLDTLIDKQVTVTGYLFGLESLYGENNWQITFFGEIPFYQIIY